MSRGDRDMPSLPRTLKQLESYRKRWAGLQHQAERHSASGKKAGSRWLSETPAFGPNPGQLKMLSYVPPGAGQKAGLVIVLHGCTQTAEAYADPVGWRQLADAHGFALLCPEQAPSSNAKRCFNWFLPADTAREGGECQSIAGMIRFMTENGTCDASRIFITGLSAGGAMASAMLATYPELFAGGSIIAGLPHGAAHNVQGAFEAMFNPTPQPGSVLGQRVRDASRHQGAWPPIAIWHGEADRTVVPANAGELAKQWLDVHGITGAGIKANKGGVTHTQWQDVRGDAAIDLYMVHGMAHGAPVRAGGADACGRAAPFVLDAGISSSLVMARAWGLASPAMRSVPSRDVVKARAEPDTEAGQALSSDHHLGHYIETTIYRALTAAGLMRK
jgi:poly(hydroxyalkanoate) depolymerase family esterase